MDRIINAISAHLNELAQSNVSTDNSSVALFASISSEVTEIVQTSVIRIFFGRDIGVDTDHSDIAPDIHNHVIGRYKFFHENIIPWLRTTGRDLSDMVGLEVG